MFKHSVYNSVNIFLHVQNSRNDDEIADEQNDKLPEESSKDDKIETMNLIIFLMYNPI